MSVQTMTLYEALAKKKILEKQVERLSTNRMCTILVGDRTKDRDGILKDDVDTYIDSTFQKSVAIMENYINLKAAINDANATIKVTIAGKEYTIANAIARQRCLDKEADMYNNILRNITICERDITDNATRKLSSEAVSNYVSKILGDSKKNEEIINQVKEQYIQDNTWTLYDPKNTKELAEKKIEEIALFREEIHLALTKANCDNEITVEFAD